MKKVIIVGTSGSGKSMLANQLSLLLKVTSYELDDYYWLPGWQANPFCLQLLLNQLKNQEAWIVNGNYTKLLGPLWRQADTIIWLDYSFTRCFLQGLKRSLKRIFYRIPCCNGNFETIQRTFFSKDSLLVWIASTYQRRKAAYHDQFAQSSSGNKYLRFQTPKQLKPWLHSLF